MAAKKSCTHVQIKDDPENKKTMKDAGQKRVAIEDLTCLNKSASNHNDFEKLAAERILAESKRAKIRAEQYGPAGWLPNKSGRPNKRFLSRLVVQTVKERERRGQREKKKVSSLPDKPVQKATETVKIED